MRALALTAVLGLSLGCGAPEDAPLSWTTTLATTEASAADQEIVLRKLASQDRVEVVWGAYLAGDLRVSGARESLLGLLQDGPFFAGYALDALARLGARVPAEQLRVAIASGVDHMTAIAVALQEPAAHRDLIFDGAQASLASLLDHEEWEYGEKLTAWHAYANALVATRDRPFAATLLASLVTGVNMEVVSPGETFPRVHCGCGAWGRSRCFTSMGHSTLPPRGDWTFESAETDDCAVLVPGPVSVCLARNELPGLPEDIAEQTFDGPEDDEPPVDEDPAPAVIVEQPEPTAREACPPANDLPADEIEVESPARNEDLLSYLRAFVGGAELPPFDGVVAVRHVWRDETAYRTSVRDARHRLERQYRELTAALRDTYALPDDMPSWTPYVDVSMSDLRSCDAGAPLPGLAD